jgi:HTH-type transcriptional regulator, sugar sensing transcriptional regulator
MNTNILKKLGLSEKELTIYLKLLETGPSSVRSLAEICKINRGSTYESLKELQNKGLVSYYNDATKQKFVAENPKQLQTLLTEESERIKALEEELSPLVSELKALRHNADNQPVSRLYEGEQGIKTILNDLLHTLENSTEKEYYVYSAKDASSDIKKAFPNFNDERKKRNIYVKAISLAKGGKTNGLDERRWLGTNDHSATFIIIYQDKCAFISRDKHKKSVGILVENQMIYHTQKIIFQKLWQSLK